MDDTEIGTCLPPDGLILLDAWMHDSDNPHGWLVFRPDEGRLVNDPTARDFGITKADAIKLAIELVLYVREGKPPNGPSVSSTDIERGVNSVNPTDVVRAVRTIVERAIVEPMVKKPPI